MCQNHYFLIGFKILFVPYSNETTKLSSKTLVHVQLFVCVEKNKTKKPSSEIKFGVFTVE